MATERKERRFRVLETVRFALPVAANLAFLITGLAYTVRGAILGKRYMFSVIRLFFNTFTGTHAYLAGAKTAADNTFFAFLAIGAAVGVLAMLSSLFFSCFALLSTVRRLFFKQRDNSQWIFLFRVLFPNRVCLFLSQCLLLLPALFPEYYTFIASRFAIDGGQAAFYVIYNIPLYVVCGALLLTAGMSFFLARYEHGDRDLFALK